MLGRFHLHLFNYCSHYERSRKKSLSRRLILSHVFSVIPTTWSKAIRRNKQNNIQRYLCKNCGKRFSFNIGFDRMHLSPQMITSALQLYFTGESFRNVQKFLNLLAFYFCIILNFVIASRSSVAGCRTLFRVITNRTTCIITWAFYRISMPLVKILS